ncbi:hypothetical protein OC844_005563 [Tilletia horrida]|nr:hypothetical protein OC844_005563 [Tilletia horrida]
MSGPPDDASARAQDAGTGVPQAQASPRVSYPENSKFVACDSPVHSALAPKLNGAGSPSADTLSTTEAGATVAHREPPTPPTPQGAHRQDPERGGATTEIGMDIDPATAPESGNASWADMTTDDEEAAAAKMIELTSPGPDRPATPAQTTKRKEPEGTPRKERDEAARRQALLDAQEMPPPPPPTLSRRRSMRIEQAGIAPASGRQQVVSGVSRSAQEGDASSAAQSQQQLPAPATRQPPAPAPTGEALAPAPTQKEKARPEGNILVLQRRIKAGLAQRRQKEEAVASFFEAMTSGLQQIDGVNALEPSQVHAIGILLTTATKVAFASPGQTPLPPKLLDYIKLWDPSKPCPPFPSPVASRPEQQGAAGTETAASSWAARAAAPPPPDARRSGTPPLAPYAGYRTQGGAKGDAAKLAASGGLKDNRTFIRVPASSSWAREDPYEIRLHLEQLLRQLDAPASLSIGRVKTVQSGFSFTPGESCSAQDFQAYYLAIQKHFEAHVVEGPCSHQRFVLRGIPAKLVSGGIAKNVTPELVQQQLAKVCPTAKLALPPRTITPERAGSPMPLWLLTLDGGSFGSRADSPCPSSIALFDRDCSLRPYRSNNASRHCDRCLSWHHSVHKCRALSPVCARCGLTGHSAAEHTCTHCAPGQTQLCIPECFHCKGPATTGHPGCRARPVWDSKVNAVIVPEGERLLRLQNRGRADRKIEIAKARAAQTAASATQPPRPSPSSPAQSTTPNPSSTPPAASAAASAPAAAGIGSATRRVDDTGINESSPIAHTGSRSTTGPAPTTSPSTHTISSLTSSASGPRSNALGGN